MIIVCQNCASRLQINEMKVPSRPFSIRCPKCNGNVDCGPSSPAIEQSAIAVGGSPATGNPRFEQPKPAPLFQLEETVKETNPAASAAEKLVELLAGAAGRSPTRNVSSQAGISAWSCPPIREPGPPSILVESGEPHLGQLNAPSGAL